MMSLLRDIFLRFDGQSMNVRGQIPRQGLCSGTLDDAVEQVVDELYSRLRAVPNYANVLRGPVATTFRHINDIAESVPGPLLCCRSTFAEDPRINAFFVSPSHIQQVFSQSKEVRQLFEANPQITECWSLLCMRKEERRQPGLALVGDDVRKDVMQTLVNFTDHQVVSPGSDEQSARCALKCCMFGGLLAHIKRRAADAKSRTQDLENRIRILRARLRSLDLRPDPEQRKEAMLAEIQRYEEQLAGDDLRLPTIKDHLQFVADALSDPADFLSSAVCSLRLNRMAIKLEDFSDESGYELVLSEIRIASHPPRIGALVRFPRDELLPQTDFLKQTDLFLAM